MYRYSNGVNLVAGGEKHRVYVKKSPTGVGKGVKGHVMVNHPTSDKGKWDTIDLTEKAGAKTVEEGKAATKKWHAENPYVSGTKSVKQYRGDENLPEAKKGMKNCGCKHPKTKYKYGTGALTIPEGSAIVTANGGKNKQALMAYKQGNHKLLNKIIDEMPEDNVDRAKNGIKNTYKKYKFKPGTKNVNAGDEDDAWIRKILTYEAKQGGFDKSTGKAYGLPNWGYNNWQKFGHSRSPRNIEEAIEYFKQDYLPKVKDYPLKLRKKLADYSYNSGRSIEDLLLLADDKIDLDKINSNATFTKEWNENKDKILKKLNSPEFIKKLDAARTDVAKTTGTYPDPNDSSKSIRYSLNNPNPAYEATWKGRIENMQDKDETPEVNQNKQNSSVVNPITVEMGTVGPTAVQGNTQGTQQQNISPAPVSTVNQNAGTTVTDPNASTTPVGSTGVQNSPADNTTVTQNQTSGINRRVKDISAREDVPRQSASGKYYGSADDAALQELIKNNPWHDWSNFDPSRRTKKDRRGNVIQEGDVEKFQKAFNKFAEENKDSNRLTVDDKLGDQTKTAKVDYIEDQPTITTTKEDGKKIDIIPPPPPKTEPQPQIPGITPTPPEKKNFMIPSLAEVAARGSILGRGIEQVPENYLKLGRYKYASQLPKTLQEIQLAEQAGREGARNVVGGDAGRYLSQSGNLSAARMKAANEAVIQDTLARQDILNKNVDLGNLEAETNTSLKNEYAQQRALARSAYDRQLIGLGQKIDNVTETAQEMAGLKNADEQRLQLLRDLGNNYEYKNVGGKYQLVPKTPVENTTPSETNTENQARKGLKRLKAYKRK